jgi:hypothetical protein
VDDYISIPHNENQNPGAQITIDAWVKRTSPRIGATIFQKRSPSNVGGYVFEATGQDSDALQFVLMIGGVYHFATTPTGTLVTGVWQHVAATYDGAAMRIYVDGAEKANAPQAGAIDPTTDPVVIGRNVVNTPMAWQGEIDEVELFNRALSQSEIQSIFNAGSVGKCKAPTPTMQFGSGGYSVMEGCGGVEVTVTRSGNSTVSATIDYATSDGTAQQRTDYTIGYGTLSFAAGETSKSFTVLANEDHYVEGPETLTVTLSNPSAGATIGSQSTASVTIMDGDYDPPTANPCDDSGLFVCQHYHDFLSRTPDQGGGDYWTQQITQCGTNAQCVQSKRMDVSNAFFYELEFQQTGAFVFRLYRAAYGNTQPFPNPDHSNQTESNKLPNYAVFARDRARVVGGLNLAQGQLDLAQVFVGRPEFVAKYPASLQGPAFIAAVLNTIKTDTGVDLGSQSSALETLFTQSGGGSAGRGAVMYRLADDNTTTNPVNNRAFIDQEYNRSFVATQYFGYLRRDSDIGGFVFWLGQVNSAGLRDVNKQHAMVCSFITAREYQERFSSVVLHTNAECPQ